MLIFFIFALNVFKIKVRVEVLSPSLSPFLRSHALESQLPGWEPPYGET